MGQLILALAPLAIGIILSPLAIMALVAVLLSHRARTNGVMFLLGWLIGIAVGLTLSYGVLGLFGPHDRTGTPTWLSAVRVGVGGVLIAVAIRGYRRGRRAIRAMSAAVTAGDVVAAAPTMPKWLSALETLSAPRALALGFGVFALNPVDMTAALLAGIDTRAAGLPAPTSYTILLVFGIIGALPIAIPVALFLILGDKATPPLQQARNWIGSHSGILTAALMLVIGVLQLQKGLSALIG